MNENLDVLLLDAQGVEVTSLPVVSMQLNDQLNDVGELTVNVALTAQPDLLPLIRTWSSNLLVLISGVPVFGGYVAKRRAGSDNGVIEITAKEWSAWFDRVAYSDTDHYGSYPHLPVDGCGHSADPSPRDAALVIAERITRAVDPQWGLDPGGQFLRPPLWDLDPTPVGFDVDVDFDPTETDRPTLADDIRRVLDFGVDYQLVWRTVAPARWLPRLEVDRYAIADPDEDLLLGADGASAVFIEDTDTQANQWTVAGVDKDSLVRRTRPDVDPYSPLLQASRSWETFEDPTVNNDRLTAAADALVQATKNPVVAVEEVSLKGLTAQYRIGGGAHVRYPVGVDPRIPGGLDLVMRVVGCTWVVGQTESATTLTLAQESDSYLPRNAAPTAGWQRRNAVQQIRHLKRQVERLSMRRP